MDLAHERVDPRSTAADSRHIHRRLFKDLTPSECAYFAGHYRGSDYPCLRAYDVTVGGSETAPAPHVSSAMELLASRVMAILACLRAGDETPHSLLSKEQKLLYNVVLAAEVHAEFLRIHPYVNGNGHIGRFIVWCILGTFGYWPRDWPFDDHPHAPYDVALNLYLAGQQEPLIQLMLHLIIGSAAAAPAP